MWFQHIFNSSDGKPFHSVYGYFVFVRILYYFSLCHINKFTQINLPFRSCSTFDCSGNIFFFIISLDSGSQFNGFKCFLSANKQLLFSIVRNHWRASIDSDIIIEIYIHFFATTFGQFSVRIVAAVVGFVGVFGGDSVFTMSDNSRVIYGCLCEKWVSLPRVRIRILLRR